MGLMPWEKTTSCPYDPSHQITVSRIQTHLIKCRRNHPTTDHVICPYNASHHIPKAEEKMHISNCCDRKIVDLAKYSWLVDTPGYHGNCDTPPAAPLPQSLNPQDYLTDLEDWVSSGTSIGSYDPQKNCEKLNVLRRLQGATRSERRKFNAAEKIRHEGLLSLDESRPSSMSQCEGGGDFHSPRPTLFRQERPTLVEDNRETFSSSRPSLVRKENTSVCKERSTARSQMKNPSGEVEQQAASVPRSVGHGSIRHRLLNMVANKKRQEIKTNANSTIETTMETVNRSVNDTLDSTVGRLATLGLQDSAGKIGRPNGVGK